MTFLWYLAWGFPNNKGQHIRCFLFTLHSLNLVGGRWIRTCMGMCFLVLIDGATWIKYCKSARKTVDRNSQFRECSMRGRYLECPNPEVRMEVSQPSILPHSALFNTWSEIVCEDSQCCSSDCSTCPKWVQFWEGLSTQIFEIKSIPW